MILWRWLHELGEWLEHFFRHSHRRHRTLKYVTITLVEGELPCNFK